MQVWVDYLTSSLYSRVCNQAFCKGFVKQNASEQLQSVIWPFHKGFVKENASEQLQSVIWFFRKGFVQGSLKYNSGHARAKVQNNKDSANIKKYCPSQT